MLARTKITESGQVMLPRTAEDDVLVLLRQLLARRGQVRARLEGARLGWYDEAMVEIERLAKVLGEAEELTGEPTVDVPALDAEAPVGGEEEVPEPLRPLVRLAPLEVLLRHDKLNYYIDGLVTAADNRVLGMTRSFDGDEARSARVVHEWSFADGRGFLQRKGRHQWSEVNLRFKAIPIEVQAAVKRLGLETTWAGIAALNDHYGTLIGVDGTPERPVDDDEVDPHDQAQAALVALILAANRIAPSAHADDDDLRTAILGPWLDLQREYAASRKRT